MRLRSSRTLSPAASKGDIVSIAVAKTIVWKTHVINPPQILLVHHPIVLYQHESDSKLKDTRKPAKRVHSVPVCRRHAPEFSRRQRGLVTPVPHAEHVLELLWNKPALHIVGSRVRAVLVLVDGGDEYAEKGVGQVGEGETGRVRKAEVDDECGQETHEDVEAQLVEADEGIVGPDLAVTIAVPEHDVLLEDGLARGRGDVSRWPGGIGDGERDSVTYVVLESQGVDIFGTALWLIGRDGPVRTSDARLADDGIDLGCLGTLDRGRRLADGCSKVDALPALDSVNEVLGQHCGRHLGKCIACLVGGCWVVVMSVGLRMCFCRGTGVAWFSSILMMVSGVITPGCTCGRKK